MTRVDIYCTGFVKYAYSAPTQLGWSGRFYSRIQICALFTTLRA